MAATVGELVAISRALRDHALALPLEHAAAEVAVLLQETVPREHSPAPWERWLRIQGALGAWEARKYALWKKPTVVLDSTRQDPVRVWCPWSGWLDRPPCLACGRLRDAAGHAQAHPQWQALRPAYAGSLDDPLTLQALRDWWEEQGLPCVIL